MLIVTDNYISRFQFFNEVWVCSVVNHLNSIAYKAHTPTLQTTFSANYRSTNVKLLYHTPFEKSIQTEKTALH